MVCGKTGRNKLDDLEISVASLFNGKRRNYVDGTAVLQERPLQKLERSLNQSNKRRFLS